MLGTEQLSIDELERTVDELVQALFERKRQFIPCYPHVFVRVCKREQVRSGIILPGAVQNKVMHEGIVLATWRPFQKQTKYGLHYMQSDLVPGNHVLFNHFAGVPIEGYDRDRYRVVRDVDFDPVNQGGIIATVEYDGNGAKPQVRITHELEKTGLLRHEEVKRIVDFVDVNFILVDRDAPSITISGV